MNSRILCITAITLFAALAVAARLAAQDQQQHNKFVPRYPLSSRRENSLPRGAEKAHPPATASRDIVWVQCPPEAQALGATCGKLPVPLDRRHPEGQTIEIYFELYSHTNPGPAESAILFNAGGPGPSITYFRALVLTSLHGISTCMIFC